MIVCFISNTGKHVVDYILSIGNQNIMNWSLYWTLLTVGMDDKFSVQKGIPIPNSKESGRNTEGGGPSKMLRNKLKLN